jgi:hypothetical protein
VYTFIWRNLPGPLPIRLALAGLLILAVGLVLWYVVFPEVAAWLVANETPPVVER